WLATIKQARQGSEWAQGALALENKIRAEEGAPSVEEELKEIAEEEELTREVERKMKMYRKN
ncbi:MAG: hypothetical protein HDT02_05240, partial [Bacteroidales bacterium]|nr:hypothetical protein [Bacteroidales bacterium]